MEKVLEIKADDISFNSQDALIHQASESISIECQDFNVNADKDIIISAKDKLSLNIGDTHIQMFKDGTIVTNKAPTIDAAIIDKHQQSLYQSGANTDFSQAQSMNDKAEQLITESPSYLTEKTLPADDNDEKERQQKGADETQAKAKVEIDEAANSAIKDEVEFELSPFFSRKSYTDDRACWQNKNEYQFSLNCKIKCSGQTRASLLKGTQDNALAEKKLCEYLLRTRIIENSSMMLTKDGKLTLSTDMPSLKGESFSVELGLDKETNLPCASAIITYEFFDYKMQTEFGELCLNGSTEMKNTFTPLKPTAMCQALIPAAQEVNKINEYAMNHKGQALMIAASSGVIASLELGPIVTSAAATLSSWLGVTSEALAEGGFRNDLDSIPIFSKDKKISVSYKCIRKEPKGGKQK